MNCLNTELARFELDARAVDFFALGFLVSQCSPLQSPFHCSSVWPRIMPHVRVCIRNLLKYGKQLYFQLSSFEVDAQVV